MANFVVYFFRSENSFLNEISTYFCVEVLVNSVLNISVSTRAYFVGLAKAVPVLTIAISKTLTLAIRSTHALEV